MNENSLVPKREAKRSNYTDWEDTVHSGENEQRLLQRLVLENSVKYPNNDNGLCLQEEKQLSCRRTNPGWF